MGQQVAFIFLIIISVMIFSQILILAKNEKTRYENLMNEFKILKENMKNK